MSWHPFSTKFCNQGHVRQLVFAARRQLKINIPAMAPEYVKLSV
jgi:hypothetical protein